MTFSESLYKYRFQLAGLLVVLAAAYSSIIQRMVHNWYIDDNYSHGFLIPFIAGWFVYRDWPRLRETRATPSNIGLLVIAAGVVQLIFAWLATEYFNMRLSLVVILAGSVLFFFGKETFSRLRLPLGYLVLMVPLPYIIYDAIAFPLKLFVTKVSVLALKIMNFAVWREGNIISFPNIVLEVADACSGMRSLMSLIAIAVTLAFLMLGKTWTRWVLVLSAIPFAVMTNAFRVIMTGVLSRYYGRAAAEGFFHEFAGMAVFIMAMVLLGGAAIVLKKIEDRSRNASESRD